MTLGQTMASMLYNDSLTPALGVGNVQDAIDALKQGTPGSQVGPSNAVYVDIAGSDTTGERGNAARPYLTVAAAMAVMLNGDDLIIGPGDFTIAVGLTMPALVTTNCTISGAGPTATRLNGAAGVDILTLKNTLTRCLIQNLSMTALTTGKCITGTGGATAAGAYFSTGLFALNLVLATSGGAVDTITLVEANICDLFNVQASTGSATFTTSSAVSMRGGSKLGATSFTWDNTDANKPALGKGSLALAAGAQVGALTLGGQGSVSSQGGSIISSLTALNLSVAAGPVSPLINIGGSIGNVDLNTTTAALPSAVLGAFTVTLAGATLLGTVYSFRVASGATRQAINLTGVTAPAAATFTGDALTDVNMRGASLTSPTYATANTGALGAGTMIPPQLVFREQATINGNVDFTFAALAGLTTLGTAAYGILISPNTTGLGAFVPTAQKSATGFRVTAVAVGTVDILVVFS